MVVRGANVGTHYLIRETKQKLGRESHCEIHLEDSEASRTHAEIDFVDGDYVLRDLGSSNGTFVNGNRITEHKLRVGDRVQIGKRLMLFRLSFRPFSAADNDVDIVPSASGDSSQIVGRVELERQLLEKTDDWTAKIQSDKASSDAKSHWEIMYRTSLAVSRTLDIDQLLHQILELIFQWVNCDRGCIMLTDLDTGELLPSCRRNRGANVTSNRMTISKTILDYVCKKEEGVLTSDACEDERWNASASISAGGIREAICVPMKGRYGSVGVIYIDTSVSAGQYAMNPHRIFSEEHLKMLVAIGHQAALAIEDTNYYQSMVQAERLAAMGQTIATLSHHIKNIVQGLRGGGYLISEGIKADDMKVVQSGWRICERNQERIESFVMDMLTMSKDRRPNRTGVDLRTVIDDVVEVVTVKATEQRVAIRWLRPEAFRTMMLDGEAIHRALMNLVGNAIDACNEKQDGCVEILLVESKDYARIQVRDNGVGIATSDLNRIFSMFESNKGNRGTGLGLPVSLKIAKEHDGTIEVKSEVGTGTEFELLLPWKSNRVSNAPEALPTMPG
ncbi:MAG: ATP-binding protein [Planctomycetota bacterium]|nr:ATP-binding protein [Planctomycetota bacterium]